MWSGWPSGHANPEDATVFNLISLNQTHPIKRWGHVIHVDSCSCKDLIVYNTFEHEHIDYSFKWQMTLYSLSDSANSSKWVFWLWGFWVIQILVLHGLLSPSYVVSPVLLAKSSSMDTSTLRSLGLWSCGCCYYEVGSFLPVTWRL